MQASLNAFQGTSQNGQTLSSPVVDMLNKKMDGLLATQADLARKMHELEVDNQITQQRNFMQMQKELQTWKTQIYQEMQVQVGTLIQQAQSFSCTRTHGNMDKTPELTQMFLWVGHRSFLTW